MLDWRCTKRWAASTTSPQGDAQHRNGLHTATAAEQQTQIAAAEEAEKQKKEEEAKAAKQKAAEQAKKRQEALAAAAEAREGHSEEMARTALKGY
jgi:hypothetical protein